MFVNRRDSWPSGHRGHHVGWFDSAQLNFFVVQLLHPVDECSVKLLCSVEIVAKRAIHERIDDVSKTDEEIEIELLEE